MYTVRPKQDPLVAIDDEEEEEEEESRGIPMHPADWDAYNDDEMPQTRCMRCGVDVAQGTHFFHCAACLATRRIDEPTLLQASARVVEGLWPLGEERLDAPRWGHALITLWREVVDPMLMRAFPYNSETLGMTLRLMRPRLHLTDALVQLPTGYGSDVVVLRTRGEILALGVNTRDARCADPLLGAPRHPEQESLDTVLHHLGLPEGWLVVEKPSHRARRDDPVKKRTVTSARGHQIHRLECRNEVRH